jgi:hypothetical protein
MGSIPPGFKTLESPHQGEGRRKDSGMERLRESARDRHSFSELAIWEHEWYLIVIDKFTENSHLSSSRRSSQIFDLYRVQEGLECKVALFQYGGSIISNLFNQE